MHYSSAKSKAMEMGRVPATCTHKAHGAGTVSCSRGLFSVPKSKSHGYGCVMIATAPALFDIRESTKYMEMLVHILLFVMDTVWLLPVCFYRSLYKYDVQLQITILIFLELCCVPCTSIYYISLDDHSELKTARCAQRRRGMTHACICTTYICTACL